MSRRPWILSPWLLPGLTTLLTLALAALCFWQWQRESSLAADLRQTRDALARAESLARTESARADSATARHIEAAARAEEARRAGQSEREELERLRRTAADRDALAAALEQANARILQANENIDKGNASARAAAGTIQRLAAERDDLARRLNERTEAYNALVKRGRSENR